MGLKQMIEERVQVPAASYDTALQQVCKDCTLTHARTHTHTHSPLSVCSVRAIETHTRTAGADARSARVIG